MNRLLFGGFALAMALQGTAGATIEKDGSVLVLTDANFDHAIKVSTKETVGRTMKRACVGRRSRRGLECSNQLFIDVQHAGRIGGAHTRITC